MNFHRALLSAFALLLLCVSAQGQQLDCTGGTVTTVAGKRIHTFLSSGTLACTGSGTADYLIVGGGGAGGNGGGGGGGGGKVFAGQKMLGAQDYPVIVGNGGAPATLQGSGGDGDDSSFDGEVAGGGGGGGGNNAPGRAGKPAGGSGGGGGATSGGPRPGGAGVAGGNSGGAAYEVAGSGSPNFSAGGGGGCGSAGQSGRNDGGGHGGLGCDSSITGILAQYGGGGGGATYLGPAGGGLGLGGAGNGCAGLGCTSAPGVDGTGGGGGGSEKTTGEGARGGSGRVVVAYSDGTPPPDPPPPVSHATPVPCIEDLGGGVGVGPDNATAFEFAVANYEAVRFCKTFAAGQYTFNREPGVINKTFAIYGALPGQSGNTWIRRNYQPSSPDRGLFHFTAWQPYVSSVMILASAGSGGRGIVIQPTANAPTAAANIEHVRITTDGGSWKNTIFVDGSSNTSPSGPGARIVTFDDVTVFGATETAAIINSVVHFQWKGGSINGAGGVNGDLLLSGTSASPSSQNKIGLDYVYGNVSLSNFSKSIIDISEVGGSVIAGGNTSGNRGRGEVLGSKPAWWN